MAIPVTPERAPYPHTPIPGSTSVEKPSRAIVPQDECVYSAFTETCLCVAVEGCGRDGMFVAAKGFTFRYRFGHNVCASRLKGAIEMTCALQPRDSHSGIDWYIMFLRRG